MARPDFLDLPTRAGKPRAAGITHVLDKGTPAADLPAFLSLAAEFVDVWKMGWGTAYLESDVEEKVALLGRHAIRACVGGTLLEAAWAQGAAEPCLAWAAEVGFHCVEVSNGAIGMAVEEKRRLIADAAGRFVVLSEVGSKDPAAPVHPDAWVDEMVGDLEAGATLVLAEGRESGTVGLYRPDGQVREDVVEAVAAELPVRRVVFEAPQRAQQAWFIRQFGPDVNLGNIPLTEVQGLEALRLGLRADTIQRHRRAPGEAAAP